MTDIVLSFTTINNEKRAKELAQQLVKDKLAACVNIVPKIRSYYEWDGEIRDDTEHLLIIKSPREKLDRVKEFIDKTHTYEVPELISFEVIDGLPDYLQWIVDATS